MLPQRAVRHFLSERSFAQLVSTHCNSRMEISPFLMSILAIIEQEGLSHYNMVRTEHNNV